MKTLIALLLAATFAHAEEMPTLMTTRGKLLVDQQFAEALPKFDGKSNGFASGFKTARLSLDDEERKLANMVEVARQVWG